MTDKTAQYYAAVTADARRVYIRAVVDITDPDIVYEDARSNSMSEYSDTAQLHDKVTDGPARYATLERNRWLLDGSFSILPDDPADCEGQMGYMSEAMCNAEGEFSPPVYLAQPFSGVSVLQACSIYFPGEEEDGYPTVFTVEIFSGDTAYFTKQFTSNGKRQVDMDGFTVNNPTEIRVTVAKWSIPYRRFRAVEIIPGLYEEWDGDIIAEFSVKQQAGFSCLSLPYGACSLSMDNLSRRFEPRNKSGLFKSIEERQGIEVYIGVRLPGGAINWQPLGVFYQYAGGWETSDNGLTMRWELVDIIGLVSNRQYMPPETLPTTLSGWIASIVAQLGINFEKRYSVDENYASLSVTANNIEDVTGKSCGDIVRWACMATGTFPRADAETGYLTAEPLWNEGAKVTLENLASYPAMQANDDLAAIIFTLADENGTEYVVAGNNTASGNTVQVQNPFIHTEEQALAAARLILSTYGGNKIETTGRGNPASEIGDVDTVWLDASSAVAARRMTQTFRIQNGVLQGCQSTLLQADGAFMFENRAVITSSGSFKTPAGVKSLRLILVGKGGNGTDGTDGTWDAPGQDGTDGAGGKVWSSTIEVNPQQVFTVTIGDETTFGPYSSADGQTYQNGFTDVQSGDSYGRTGVQAPLPGSGDGGAGGKGGVQGNQEVDSYGFLVEIFNYPGQGSPGVAGAQGCAVVYWDKGEEAG